MMKVQQQNCEVREQRVPVDEAHRTLPFASTTAKTPVSWRTALAFPDPLYAVSVVNDTFSALSETTRLLSVRMVNLYGET